MICSVPSLPDVSRVTVGEKLCATKQRATMVKLRGKAAK